MDIKKPNWGSIFRVYSLGELVVFFVFGIAWTILSCMLMVCRLYTMVRRQGLSGGD
jgi:hypothetical protein